MKVSRRKLAIAAVDQLRAGKNPRAVANQLAAYLLEHKMTGQVDLLVSDIAQLLATNEGHLLTEITSAFKLSTETRKQVTDYVQKQTGAKYLELVERVDPDLLGGFRLQIPGQELDASVRHKLNQLQA